LREAKIGELPICSKFAVEMMKLALAVGLHNNGRPRSLWKTLA
jgi:hypothetical protein